MPDDAENAQLHEKCATYCALLREQLSEVTERWRLSWAAADGDISSAVTRTVSRLVGALIDTMAAGAEIDQAGEERLASLGSALALAVVRIIDIYELLQLLRDAFEASFPDERVLAMELSRRLMRALWRVSAFAAQRFLEDVEQRLATDSVTGLRRGDFFESELKNALTSAAQSGGKVTIALIDLNDLKRYNDEHGYDEGNAQLRALADALQHDDLR